MKILITGASGFIGTNLLADLLAKGYDCLNIDCRPPRNGEHRAMWENVDICDFNALEKAVLAFVPDTIVHLAARTDLDGKTLADYEANTKGTENLLRAVKALPDLRKVVIASSKFVTRNGYRIRDQFDTCPHTVYGESKVAMEKLVWAAPPKCDWCIIRPTSIWGPWFATPYRDFFDMVMKHMYFHIGKTKCHKTYGYIGNAVYQIEQLLFTETPDLDNKVFYIGDDPPYEINEWADEIAAELGFTVPTVPVWMVKALAKLGDFLGLFGVHFPMQSFRFGNMTNDGINDMASTYRLAPETPCTRLEGTKATIQWIRSQEGRKP